MSLPTLPADLYNDHAHTAWVRDTANALPAVLCASQEDKLLVIGRLCFIKSRFEETPADTLSIQTVRKAEALRACIWRKYSEQPPVEITL